MVNYGLQNRECQDHRAGPSNEGGKTLPAQLEMGIFLHTGHDEGRMGLKNNNNNYLFLASALSQTSPATKML